MNGSQPQFIWNVCGKLVVGNLIFFLVSACVVVENWVGSNLSFSFYCLHVEERTSVANDEIQIGDHLVIESWEEAIWLVCWPLVDDFDAQSCCLDFLRS